MKVRALKLGFFGQRRRPGDVFEIQSLDQLGRWMELLEPAVQEAPRQKRQYRKRGDNHPQA